MTILLADARLRVWLFFHRPKWDAENPRFRKAAVDIREKVHRTLISALTISPSSNRTD
jgi:hypothetical protein